MSLLIGKEAMIDNKEENVESVVMSRLVTNFNSSQLIHYYEAIKRDRQYNTSYRLTINQKSMSSGLRQDGMVKHPVDGLHALLVEPPNADLSRFWMTFREIEEEAIGFMKR